MNAKMNVTVFMPTYNSQEYLVEALESLRLQTYADYNVVMMDGGSTDLTSDICMAYCRKDPRFSFVVREGTTPPERFNEMLSSCESDFLANAHSDDFQNPNRLELQVAHMLASPDTVLSGTDTFFWLHDFYNSWGNSYNGIAQYPRLHEDIRCQLPFWWCFANPTLIFRTEHFRRNRLYMDTKYKYTGDYLYYWRIASTGRVDNLDKVLVAYRHHSRSEGPKNRCELEKESREIRMTIFKESGLAEYLGPELTADLQELKVERNIITGCPSPYRNYESLFKRMMDFSKENNAFSESVFIQLFDDYLSQIRAIKGIVEDTSDKNTTVGCIKKLSKKKTQATLFLRRIARRLRIEVKKASAGRI